MMKSFVLNNRILFIVSLLSFPIYILLNNLLVVADKLLHLKLQTKPSLYIVGFFCESRPPEIDSNRYFAIFIILKYLLLAGALLVTRKKQSGFLDLLYLVIAFLFLIDFYSAITVLTDSYFQTGLNFYFFSSAFTMGAGKVYTGSFASIAFINGIIGFALLRMKTKSWNQFLQINLLVLISVVFSCVSLYFLLRII